MRPNPKATAPAALVLDGEDLELEGLAIDGVPVPAERYSLTVRPPHHPAAAAADRSCSTIETAIDPSANTQLMGLYRSGGTYCTQCEAEGFRRITYFPDRPDVMAVYTTRIEADKAEAPVLLANGNLVKSGDLAGGRHFAVWHDPFPKPSYLFALVGGDLACVADRFVTMSGREVDLRIYVEHGKEGRCAYAMDALKRSMRWDEQAFGREYDLDVFMIVAVSDFNMGAMENKGLNIFNDKYVLASQETATDADFAHVEGIIAHEYFHNWTGNRITCRDWFQLCLKEGLTVFRDQEFTADQRSRPVKRIADVRLLRAHQFTEDAGPLAHPVRPAQYSEINNFYTATVYEKGSEVVRMLKVLLGRGGLPQGHGPLFRAPRRAGGDGRGIHPVLRRRQRDRPLPIHALVLAGRHAGSRGDARRYDAKAKTYRLDVAQVVPPTPGQPSKEPMVIPLVIGLLDRDGNDMPLTARRARRVDGVLVLTRGGAELHLRPRSRSRRCCRSTGASRRRSRSSPTSRRTICGSWPRTTATRSTAGRRCRRWRRTC